MIINPESTELWTQAIRTQDGYSEEMLNAFRRAIAINAHNASAYRAAMNFSSPRWGGNNRAQLEIIGLAEKNNPNSRLSADLFSMMKRDLAAEAQSAESKPSVAEVAQQE